MIPKAIFNFNNSHFTDILETIKICEIWNEMFISAKIQFDNS